MPAWPESLQLLFDRVAARLRLLAMARGVVIAAGLSLPVVIARATGALSLAAALIASVVVAMLACAWLMWRSPRTLMDVAARIESRTPAAKNLLITAAELSARAQSVRADVRDVVFRDAADCAARIDVAALFPARRVSASAVVAVALLAAGLSVNGQWIARARDVIRAGAPGAPSIARVVVTVTPPAYSGRPAQSLTDPERIDALAGSLVHVEADATADHVDLIGIGERHALVQDRGVFRGDVTASADGFIAVQPFGTGDAAGVRRVISLGVTPDRSPVARILAPGKDLFVPTATATLPVKIEASDDIGLKSLHLTYTKVTGSGENFTFKDGEFPLEITRTSPEAWSATSWISLASLGLEAGDVLVYRAVVGDTLPGREPIESDAFVIEIVRRGEALGEGFSIDEEKDKYAISQQMIIIKTERLIAKKATMTTEAFTEEAQIIASEQRKVRSEFVFMMGGEFEEAAPAAGGDLNEEEEAANEAELLAGRMQNNGRQDIIAATRHMSDAVMLLTNLNPLQALPREKAALVSLQRAFTKSRYILRVLTPRERIDDSRRLSGKLTDAAVWRRTLPDVPNDPRATALLGALAGVGRVAALAQYGPAEANQLASIAEAILRVDATLAPVAQAFAQAGASIAASKSAAETSSLIDAAAAKLSTAARRGLPSASQSVDPSRARLLGALSDAMKKGSVRR